MCALADRPDATFRLLPFCSRSFRAAKANQCLALNIKDLTRQFFMQTDASSRPDACRDEITCLAEATRFQVRRAQAPSEPPVAGGGKLELGESSARAQDGAGRCLIDSCT